MYRSREKYTTLEALLIQIRKDIADVHASKSSIELKKDPMYVLLLKLASQVQLSIWHKRKEIAHNEQVCITEGDSHGS